MKILTVGAERRDCFVESIMVRKSKDRIALSFDVEAKKKYDTQRNRWRLPS
jgi:hypothetical protein